MTRPKQGLSPARERKEPGNKAGTTREESGDDINAIYLDLQFVANTHVPTKHIHMDILGYSCNSFTVFLWSSKQFAVRLATCNLAILSYLELLQSQNVVLSD